MPNGYNRISGGNSEIVYEKIHKNGERTRVELGPIPNSGGRWFGFVKDMGRSEELGEFSTKQQAVNAAKQWMRNHPKGLQQSGAGNTVIPGSNPDNLFGI